MLQGFCVTHEELGAAVDGPDRRLEVLVGQVIATLRVRDGRAMPLDDVRTAQIADRMIAACLARESDAMHTLAAVLQAEGVAPDDLTDCIIPVAARELGRAWEDDRLSFVEVTLAMTRIQRFLRDTLADVPEDGPGPSVLFALPEGEQHTLGGLLAVRQLRRMRCSVCLRIGEKARSVVELLHMRRFDALFISVATAEGLEIACDLIKSVRHGYPHPLPVAVGGAVLCGTDQATADRMQKRIGAEIVSNDLARALRVLKLAPQRDVRAVTA